MTRYFNRASSLTGLRRVAAQTGEDVGAAMRACGLSTELFKTPTAQIDFADMCALFEYCAEEWQMPDLGLRLASYQHLDILGPVALATKMEPDTRRAMASIIRNLVIHSNALAVSLEETGDVAGISVEIHPKDVNARQYLFLALGVALNVLRQVAGTKVDPIEVSFRHDGQQLKHIAQRHFGCPARFEAERNIVYFNQSVLSQKIENSDAAYHALISRYLITARYETGERLIENVRQEVARQMELGCCTLAGVSSALNLNARGLQRKLAQEGITFAALVDAWRGERAKLLLKQTRLPLSHISEGLGYADQTVFSRAFRRWFGESPMAFRQRARVQERGAQP